jgi:drug/metabolite transporter (DMT)-like permease
MSPARIKAYFLLLLVTIIWAVAAIVIKFTLDGITPLPFLAYRFLISAGIGAIAIFMYRGRLPKSLKTWAAITIYSFLSTTFALGLLFLGLDRTTVLNLSLITLAGPLLLEVAGVIFLKEKISKREKVGTAIAFAGALLTILEPIFEANASFGGFEGNLLILIYMVGDIASIILLKKLIKKEISATILTHISFVIGLVTLIPILVIFMGVSPFVQVVSALPVKYHLGVIYMAIMSGTVAYALRAKAQKEIEVGEAGLFGYLVSVFSAPLAVFFLHEEITPLFIVGAVLIAVGVFVAEYRKKRS